MATKLPVTELKDLATAIALSANAVDAVLADGKVDGKDLVRIPQLLMAVKAYTAVDLKEVLPEAADLDSMEGAELAAHFKAVFNLADDAKEAWLEKGLEIVLQSVEALRAILSMVKAVLPAKPAA